MKIVDGWLWRCDRIYAIRTEDGLYRHHSLELKERHEFYPSKITPDVLTRYIQTAHKTKVSSRMIF